MKNFTVSIMVYDGLGRQIDGEAILPAEGSSDARALRLGTKALNRLLRLKKNKNYRTASVEIINESA